MDTKMTQEELNQKLRERFQEIPKVLQEAITSANVEKQLRELATKHKLHVDMWQLLENEVIVTLLGLQPADDLAANLQNDLGLPKEASIALARDVSTIVFAPVRQELERTLEHPEAKSEEESDVDTVRTQILEQKPTPTSTSLPPLVKPATPPPQPPTQKIERGPASGAYVPGEVSSARKSIVDDPYREAPQ